MMDRKEVDIISYLELEEEKRVTEQEMATNPVIVELKENLTAIEEEINRREYGYRENIQDCGKLMQNIKERMIEHWDIKDKSFKCDAGAATLRITRSLKIDNTERLISILQQIGKLTESISGWNLGFLRMLADAGLFDVDAGETNIVHYGEKKNVIISAVKNEEKK